jgi:p-aminobenzoyl-glutamate transporter AbgT
MFSAVIRVKIKMIKIKLNIKQNFTYTISTLIRILQLAFTCTHFVSFFPFLQVSAISQIYYLFGLQGC